MFLCFIIFGIETQIVVRRWDGARIWYPTQLLVAAPIFNVTRVDSRCQTLQARSQRLG